MKIRSRHTDRETTDSGFRFNVSGIEGSEHVLIENENRILEAGLYLTIVIWMGPLLIGFIVYCARTDFRVEGESFGSLFLGFLIIGGLLGMFFLLLLLAIFGLFHSLFPRRILIHDGTLRFQGMPFCGLVVRFDQIEAVYLTTTRLEYYWYCRVAFAINTGKRTRLLYVNGNNVFRGQGLAEEKEKDLILAHRPIANLLKRIVGKPVKIQRHMQKAPKKIRAYWR